MNKKVSFAKQVLNTLDKNLYRFIVGQPTSPPPYAVKRATIEEYAKKFATGIFIETGTYLGETVDVLKNSFKKLISIELDTKLAANAKGRFKNYSHITILQGDSSELLPSILASINEPALFWLDGHYSGGITAKGDLNTPILKELQLILNHEIKKHVILIDDARCFIGENDYPTIQELFSFVRNVHSDIDFSVGNDIIRITPHEGDTTVKSRNYREPLRQTLGHQYRRFRQLGRKLIGHGEN